ncbi:pyridoxamine 5'-phosphate oxidase family protein [Streptomyces pactum]|uniref:pyridoxamine 5'-phosphate oxidase family protein n=1 Tax=Streptomyces pactum TaxID=68249 RepID=UPI0037001AD4
MQRRLGTVERADRFYDEQVLDHLNPKMREFVSRQEMFFLATADRHGECDSTFRAGPPGFLQVFDDRTLAYPEYRGNGVLASLGNIEENPHVGILLIDFLKDRIGLHVNGSARLVEDDLMRRLHPGLPVDPVPGRRAVVWVEVSVEEAYIHCAKHIPRLAKAVPRQSRGADRGGVRPPEERPAPHPAPEAEPGAPGHPEPVRGRADGSRAPEQGPPARVGAGREGGDGHDGRDGHGGGAGLDGRNRPEDRGDRGVRENRGRYDPGRDGDEADAPRRSDRDWGTDDVRRKGGDFFGAAAEAGLRAPRRTPVAGRREQADPARWRREAERALARAERRAAEATTPFTGWFG